MKFCSWDIETYKPCFIISAEDDEGPFDYITCDFVDAEIVRDFLYGLKKYDYHTTYNGKGFDIRVLCWIVNEYRLNPSRRRFIPVKEVGEQAQLYIKETNENKPRYARTSKIFDVKYDLMESVRKNHFDVMIYTSTISASPHSLKYWELARGWSIKESSVPFDVDSMTKEEVLECARYCRHDVHATWKLTHEKDCIELIEARTWVRDNCEIPVLPDVTQAELAEAYVYGNSEVPMYGSNVEKGEVQEEDCYSLVPWNDFIVPNKFKTAMMNLAIGKWKGFIYNGKEIYESLPQNSEEIKQFGMNDYMKLKKSGRLDNENWLQCGAGGAHYCRPGYNKTCVINDVASLYPHIIKGILGLKTKKALARYVGCMDMRLEMKHLKGTPEYSKSKDKGLKLVLNSLSGRFRMPGCKANCPNHGLAMCIIGQLLILEATAYSVGIDSDDNIDMSKVIEINTDSFAVEGEDNIKRAREYCAKVQHGYFAFEEEIFFESYWKDVNHYVVFNEDGSIKETHGEDAVEDAPIIIKSIYANCRKPDGAKLELVESDDVSDYLVKYQKQKGAKNALINGKPMQFKNYAFLWVTKDCPDVVDVHFNGKNYGEYGEIQPRRGVVIMGGIEEAQKYFKYIDKEQVFEYLRSKIGLWHRPDMAVELDIFGNVKMPKNPPRLMTYDEIKSGTSDSNEFDLF